MRGRGLTSLAWVGLALLAGLVLLGVDYWRHGVPPRVLAAVMSTRLGDRLAQAGLKATAPPAPEGVTVLGPGDPIPAWTLPDVHGVPQSFAQWRGKRLLINFWATWCIPCRKEMPMLAAAQRAHAGKVQIVGIAMDDPRAVRAFLAGHPPDYPMLLGDAIHPDPRAVLGNTRLALPFSVLVDRNGRIVRTRLGPLDADDLQRWLR